MIRLVLPTCLLNWQLFFFTNVMKKLYNYEWDQWVIGLNWIFPRTRDYCVGCYTWRMRSRRFSTKSTNGGHIISGEQSCCCC